MTTIQRKRRIFKEPVTRKVLLSLLLVALMIMAGTNFINSTILDKTFAGDIDRAANRYYDTNMKKALVTFALVRGLNGVISVIQDSELAFSPAGVGVTVAAGEILDPLNDMIERFSWVMLASSTSLGIQKVLMNIFAWLGFRIFLTVALLLILIGMWFPGLLKADVRQLGIRFLLLALLTRYAFPTIAVATGSLDKLFLRNSYRQATEALTEAAAEIESPETPVEAGENPGTLDKIRNAWEGFKNTVKLEERIQLLKNRISEYTQYIVDLIIVFMLQTILIPLFIFWILLRLTSSLFGFNALEFFEGKILGRRSQAV